MSGMKLKLLAFTLMSLDFKKTVSAQNLENVLLLSKPVSSAFPYQPYDLRLTIPGEPGKDYPIYSNVPDTNFECSGRFEGYYADVETRCQAFRICTNNNNRKTGFAFLCPNGTLFSQEHFVCDWYRGIDCSQSEQFYYKNSENRIGSTNEIFETVRQMMEHPIKSMNIDLNDNQKPLNNIESSSFQNFKTRSVESTSIQPIFNRKPTEFTRSTLRSSKNVETTAQLSNFKTLSTHSDNDFNRKTGKVLVEHPFKRNIRTEEYMNFAEKINLGLIDFNARSNDEVIAPDYVKEIVRSQRNLNLSLEPSTLAPLTNSFGRKVSWRDYEVNKERIEKTGRQLFNFLSRGFETTNKEPYFYNKPTTSTEFLIEAIDIQPSSITPNVRKELDFAMPVTSTTSGMVEETLQTATNANYFDKFPMSSKTMDLEFITTSKTPISFSSANLNNEKYIKQVYTPASMDQAFSDRLEFNDATSEPSILKVLNVENSSSKYSFEEDEKIGAQKEANNLLLAGLKLSVVDNVTDNRIDNVKAPLNKHYVKQLPTDTVLFERVEPTTKSLLSTSSTLSGATSILGTMKTSTEMITEINTQIKRIRSFRKLNKNLPSENPTIFKRAVQTTPKIPTSTRPPKFSTTKPRFNRVIANLHRERLRTNTLKSTTISDVEDDPSDLSASGSSYDSSRHTHNTIGNKTHKRWHYNSKYNTTTTRTTTTTKKPSTARKGALRSRYYYAQLRVHEPSTTETSLTSIISTLPDSSVSNIKSGLNHSQTLSTIHTLSPSISILSHDQSSLMTDTSFQTDISELDPITTSKNFLSFDKLTKAISDDSILQSFRKNQSSNQENNSFEIIPSQERFQLIVPKKSQQLYQFPPQLSRYHATSQTANAQPPTIIIAKNPYTSPNILIAKVEPQKSLFPDRTANSRTHKTPEYLPLNDFLVKNFQTQQKPSEGLQYNPEIQSSYEGHQITRNQKFSSLSQHQNQFSEVSQDGVKLNTENQHNDETNIQLPPYQNRRTSIGSVNVYLPAVAATNLIPSIRYQVAQKRSDESQHDRARTFAYFGVSSYDVPIGSIGPLSNDEAKYPPKKRKY